MTSPGDTHPAYRHGLLVHDTDEQLVEGTRAFVDLGLTSGGDVLVHGSRDRVALLREALGTHPRLAYGFDEDLYQSPVPTLFSYQRTLAERPTPTQLWVAGTVPLGLDATRQAAWLRYESAVDEALGAFPFAALCTYDTRTRPDAVIAGALATHRTVNVDLVERENPEYVAPAAFLDDPLARRLEAPAAPPSSTTVIHDLEHLAAARDLVKSAAYEHSAVSAQVIEQLRVAVTEVVSNGLLHGRPPVRVCLWTEVARLTCLVEDAGPGHLDPMTGYRRPTGPDAMGLWAARQMVDDLLIESSPTGGCRVLMTVTDQPL
ncbi:MEDS domain-containing protein [Nocardioides sp. MAHUQ-72]|uniref:MEDS domain-containing protein n=1 Tax=unclassified Nocardioides TaxID=2615069 RepID=UPI003622A72B